jgi:hypothetical protein
MLHFSFFWVKEVKKLVTSCKHTDHLIFVDAFVLIRVSVIKYHLDHLRLKL